MKPVMLCLLLIALVSGPVSAHRDRPVISATMRGLPREVELFDEHGEGSQSLQILRERLVFNGDGRIRQRETYDGGGRLLFNIAYHYRSSGPLRKMIARDEAGEIQWTQEFRHRNDTLLQESLFGSDGTLEFTELYEYDADGKLVEQARYTGGGIPQWRTVYEYDTESRKTTWTMQYSDGRVLKQGVEERNSEGLIAREILRDEVEQTFQEVQIRYDNRGRVTERRISDAEGVLQAVERLRYDGRDNIVEEVVERFDGTLIRHTVNDYRYDRHGNWIERVTMERERPEFGPMLETERRQVRTIRY